MDKILFLYNYIDFSPIQSMFGSHPCYSPNLSTLNSIFSHLPMVRIHSDGPRLAQLSGYQHFPLLAVSRGDRDALVARVSPVDVLVNPVDGQALRGMERVDERHLLRRVTRLVDVSTGGLKRCQSVLHAEF